MAFNYSWKQIQNLSSEQYASLMKQPGFAEYVDSLEAQHVAQNPEPVAAVDSGEFDGNITPAAQLYEQEHSASASSRPSQPAPRAPESVEVEQASEEPTAAERIHSYVYEAKDNGGNVIRKQTFRYRDKNDLIAQLTQSHIHMMRHLKEIKLARTIEDVTASDLTVPVASPAAPPVLLSSRELTVDEKLRVQLLTEQGKLDEAQAILLNARLGNVDEFIAQSNSDKLAAYNARVAKALQDFQSKHPEFVKSESNAKAIVAVMVKINKAAEAESLPLPLPPTEVASWEFAYNKVKQYLNNAEEAALEVEPAPTVLPAAPVVAAPAVAEPIAAPTRPVVMPPSGLTRNQASDGEPVPLMTGTREPSVRDANGKVWTAKDINALTSDQMKKIIVTNPKLAAAFDKIISEDEAKKSQRRQRQIGY